MKKILNYIATGQGLGIKFLILFTAIVALIFSIYIRFAGADLIPYAQDIADQMLPIKVVNGVVVEPAETVKIAHLNLGDGLAPMALPLVINTTVDNLDITALDQGAYLTRKAFYVINQNDTRIYPLQGSFELPQGDYRDDFKSGLTWAAVAFFIFGSFGIFVFYFILSIFYAACSYAVSAIASKKFDFDLRMRMSVLCLISAYIFFTLLGWMGIESGRLVFFIIVIGMQGFIISKLPSIVASPVSIPLAPDAPAAAMATAWPEPAKPEELKAPLKKAPAKKASAKKPETIKKPAAKAAKVPEKKTDEKKSPAKKIAAPKKTTAKKTTVK